MNSTGRVGCQAARAGRLVAATATALAAANAWAITGLILVTGVPPCGPVRTDPKAVPRTCFKLAAQQLGSVCCAAAGLSMLRSSWAQYAAQQLGSVYCM